MQIEQNKSLKKFNTFGIDVKARRYVSIKSVDELINVLSNHSDEAHFLLGGGSNMLLTKDIDALVIHLNLKGISKISEDQDTVILEVQAGENWHEFVLFCIANDYGGLENMSLIPGNVGTSPIQNIGAYGVELKDAFIRCEALEIASLETKIFTKEDCKFGYRNSVFKNEAKGKYIITSVRFQLTKRNHVIRTSYGAIVQALENEKISEATIKDVSDAIIAIRNSKLPNPEVLGNSGSFFKNPIVDKTAFGTFINKFPKAPYYVVSENEFKIPAGWLIEQAGFKGKRFGDAGVHKNQALVLVNHGDASGKEIWELAMQIQKQVALQFGITITPEVNVF